MLNLNIISVDEEMYLQVSNKLLATPEYEHLKLSSVTDHGSSSLIFGFWTVGQTEELLDASCARFFSDLLQTKRTTPA